MAAAHPTGPSQPATSILFSSFQLFSAILTGFSELPGCRTEALSLTKLNHPAVAARWPQSGIKTLYI
jgi:hypothetical protein